MIKVFITNLRKYNEGYLSGKYISLPIDEGELQEEVNNILGADEEYFISDYESPFYISSHEDVFKLNNWLEEVSYHCKDLNVVKLMLDEYNNNEDEVLNTLENGNYRIWYTSDMGEVAKNYLEDCMPGWEDFPETIHNHFDYDSYGEELYESGEYSIDKENKLILQIYS